MDDYKTTYGLRWLPQHFKRYPNAYYNYKKQRKAGYDAQKKQKQKLIREVYHAYAGRPGRRIMLVYLRRRGASISKTTMLKYMREL